MDLKAVVGVLEELSPTSLAEKWDNVGLLVEPSAPHHVQRILLTNDLTEAVLEEARALNVQLIVSYHPPIFAALKRLTQGNWKERIIVKAIESRIAVYSPHTSFDTLGGGVNDWLLSAIPAEHVKAIDPLTPSESKTHLTPFGHRLVTIVSKEDLPAFKSKLEAAKTISHIFVVQNETGEARVEYSVRGGGRVSGGDSGMGPGAGPVRELLVSGLLGPHAGATCILDVVKPPLTGGAGQGRVANLNQPISLKSLIAIIKTHLGLPHVRVALPPGKDIDSFLVRSVAVCAGSGASVLKGVRADVWWTGELAHHEVLDAVHRNTAVILCDHSNTERGYLAHVATNLQTALRAKTARLQPQQQQPTTTTTKEEKEVEEEAGAGGAKSKEKKASGKKKKEKGSKETKEESSSVSSSSTSSSASVETAIPEIFVSKQDRDPLAVL